MTMNLIENIVKHKTYISFQRRRKYTKIKVWLFDLGGGVVQLENCLVVWWHHITGEGIQILTYTRYLHVYYGC